MISEGKTTKFDILFADLKHRVNHVYNAQYNKHFNKNNNDVHVV